MKQLLLLLCVCLVSFTGNDVLAQVKTPAPSPLSTVTQKVGLSEITIEYSRPGVKGRKIFGELVPYGEMWRTGANGSTDITFSDDATIKGVTVKAGKYALYTIPNKAEWDIILHSNTEVWGVGNDYDAEGEVLHITVPAHKVDFAIETLTIGVDNLHNNGANLLIMWENTLVTVPFELGTHDMVMETINSTMSGPSANDYYSAGRYLYESGTDEEKAYEFVSKACDMRNDAFWMYRMKSQIEADMGNYDKAIATAKHSKELAEKAGNSHYVSLNEASIKEWSMK